MEDLTSHGVTDEIQLGIHADNRGELFYIQISEAIIEKCVLLNTVESMHHNVTNFESMLMFSCLMIMTGTIRKL